MGPKDADGMAKSVDPDRGAVWSESTLFAKTCLSENLGSLRYYSNDLKVLDRQVWANNVDTDQTRAV